MRFSDDKFSVSFIPAGIKKGALVDLTQVGTAEVPVTVSTVKTDNFNCNLNRLVCTAVFHKCRPSASWITS